MITIDMTKLLTAADKKEQSQTDHRSTEQAEARLYLAQTDWYVTRMTETQTPIPEDVAQNRAAARAALD